MLCYAKSLQSCPTLRDPMDCSLPGSSVHGIFQARVLEWSAIAFSEHFSLAPSKWSGYICQAGRLTESHFVISGYAFLLLGVLPTSHHCVSRFNLNLVFGVKPALEPRLRMRLSVSVYLLQLLPIPCTTFSGNSVRLYFSGLQNHCRWWLQPWN